MSLHSFDYLLALVTSMRAGSMSAIFTAISAKLSIAPDT